MLLKVKIKKNISFFNYSSSNLGSHKVLFPKVFYLSPNTLTSCKHTAPNLQNNGPNSLKTKWHHLTSFLNLNKCLNEWLLL